MCNVSGAEVWLVAMGCGPGGIKNAEMDVMVNSL